MGAVGGVVGGVLALTALQALVSSKQASGRVGSLLTGTATVIEHLASPNVPAIPDLRGAGSSSGSTSTTGTAPVQPAAQILKLPTPATRLPLNA